MSRAGPGRVLVALCLLAGTCLALVWAAALNEPARLDAALLNQVLHTTQERWGALEAADYAGTGAQVSVIGSQGELVLTTAHGPSPDPVQLLGRNASNRVLSAPVVVDGQLVGVVVVDDGSSQALRASRVRVAQVASGAVLAAVALAATAVWVTDRQVVAPFRNLEAFAHKIAQGRLDEALPRERGKVFGAWSQAFDLMRTELRAAREREQEARAAMDQLVADISHDIRTPLATITATTELLRDTTADPSRLERLSRVVGQVHRIDSLVTDLVRAHTVEEPALVMALSEVETSQVAAVFAENDPRGLVRLGQWPQALVRVDLGRLAQVVANLVANSYKYADPPIEVSSRVLPDDSFVEVRVADQGHSAPVAELDLLTRRGHRGANAEGTPGQGLGLHTAATLVERMGGSLTLSVGPGGGLVVTLLLPLA